VFEREIPLRRVGTPDDFGKLCVMLSGDHYLSGLNLPASGGMQLTRSPRGDELFPSSSFSEP